VQRDHSAIDVSKWLSSYLGRFTWWEGTPAHTEEEVGLVSDTVWALLNGGKSFVAPGFFGNKSAGVYK
jgi:hypothetical protein